MNERIKKLRKSLGLTQVEFGDRIGVKQSSIATYESGRNEPIDAVISAICREFGVREAWLRTGEEPMKEPEPVDEAAEFARTYGVEEHLVRLLLSLPYKTQTEIVDTFRMILKDDPIAAPAAVDLDAEVAEYRRQRELEVSQVERSSVSIVQGGK